MKILYLNPNGTVGGAEVALLHLMAALRTSHPDWTLSLITGAEGPLVQRAQALGVSARTIPFPRSIGRLGDSGLNSATGSVSRPAFLANLVSGGIHTPAYLLQLRRAAREFRPDVIHSNGFKMHLLSTYVPQVEVPVVWHVHDYVRSRAVTAPLLRFCASRCSTAVANSDSVAEDLRSLGARLKVESVYNGIDTEAFAPEGPALDLDTLAGLRPLDKLNGGAIRVGLLGTFARWKGHEVFLRALAAMDRSIPIRGYVLGGPIYQTDQSQHTLAELKNLAYSLGLRGRVGFTGFIDDPAQAIRSLDVVVHASTQPEPFGLVIVEAMACGKAVIVSNGGGASELVENGVNAFTYQPGDSAALAARIQQLAASPWVRAQLGRNARQTAEQRFTRTRFADEFAKIYRRLAGTWN
jgi:glycosyltransferase involved in cell wall biosynthesis